ncbi:MAG: DUF58 domain-containing protein [Lentisphaerae bacterium]|nr:DUF58 domain-containing protein [Lentisphaerota bacterium]
MIVPGNRLLAWAAALLPFAALAGLVPSSAPLAAALFGALGGVAAVDACLARLRRRGVRVALPPVVRLTLDRPGAIAVFVATGGAGGRPRLSRLRVGLPLPEAVRSEHDAMEVALPRGAARCRVKWPCLPGTRGRYLLERCLFEVPSPLGFWHARGASACRSEIRVYPSLAEDRRRLAALFLNRGLFGLHTQRMVGQGRDFEKLREYLPGDSYDDIHWKATAKRGRPVTKLFQIEKTQEVYVLVDTSRMSGKTSDGQTVLDRYIAASLVMGLAAEQQGDLFGLGAFGSRMRRFIRAGSGRAHYSACRDAAHALDAEVASPDFDELFSFVRLRLRRRALLMILTDLGDPVLAETFLERVDLVCRQHVVLVCMLREADTGPLFAGDAGDADVYRRLAGHLIWHDLREIERSLRRKGVRLAVTDKAALSVRLVTEYMNVKARQLL